MNPDRPGRWYLAAFLVAVGVHVVLLTALPARPPAAARKTAPVEVELVAARPREALAPEPSSAPPEPPPARPEVPPEPEPLLTPPPPAQPAVSQTMPLPKAAPRPVSSPSKPQAVSPSTTAAAPSAKNSRGGIPGGASGVVRKARPDAPRNRPPHYPEMARRNGWNGRVLVRAQVSAAGRVTSVALQRGSGYGVLDQDALVAVKSWSFLPGSVGGTAADTVVEVPVNFSLRR